MIRRRIRTLCSLGFPLHLNYGDYDAVSEDTAKMNEAQNATGWDRLKKVFKKDEFGRISIEAHTIIQTACISSFVGALYGGVVNSRDAYINFMKNNQATAFNNPFEAKRKLQDAVTLSFAKGAFKWGWRLTIFSTMYVTTCTGLAAYRGKNGILEHLAAGSIAGLMYKFQMGPRACIVGGVLGLALGGIAGTVTLSLLKLSGMTMEDVKYWNYKWANTRTEAWNKALTKCIEEEQMQLLTERDRTLGNVGLESLAKDTDVKEKK